MNYIIKPGEWIVMATYPSPNSFIRPHLTKHLNIFTSNDLVFRGKDIFDFNIENSPLVIFLNGAWWGFRKGYNILIIIPKNISNLGIKKILPKIKPIVPFENMYTTTSQRMSFDEWLKEINYEEKLI